MSKEEDNAFPKKWLKKLQCLSDGWMDGIESSSTEDIEDVIVKAEKCISQIEKDMAADPILAGAKETVKDISSGYKDAISVEVAKIKYCVYVLENRGG